MIKLLLLTLIPLVALAEEKIAHKHNATPRHFGGKSYKINFVYFADADIPFSKQQELVRFAVAAVPRKIKIAKEIFSEVNPCKDMGVEDLWGVRNCYEKHTSGRLKQKQDGKKFVIAVGPAMPSFSGVRYVGGNADICGRGKGWGFGFYTFGKGLYKDAVYGMAHEIGHLIGAYHDQDNANIMFPWVPLLTGPLGFNEKAYKQIRRCEYFRKHRW